MIVNKQKVLVLIYVFTLMYIYIFMHTNYFFVFWNSISLDAWCSSLLHLKRKSFFNNLKSFLIYITNEIHIPYILFDDHLKSCNINCVLITKWTCWDVISKFLLNAYVVLVQWFWINLSLIYFPLDKFISITLNKIVHDYNRRRLY